VKVTGAADYPKPMPEKKIERKPVRMWSPASTGPMTEAAEDQRIVPGARNIDPGSLAEKAQPPQRLG